MRVRIPSCPGRGAAQSDAPLSRDPWVWTMAMDPGSATHHAARHSASKTRVNALMALRSIRGTPMGGKICRNGINCRGGGTVRGAENPDFFLFFRWDCVL